MRWRLSRELDSRLTFPPFIFSEEPTDRSAVHRTHHIGKSWSTDFTDRANPASMARIQESAPCTKPIWLVCATPVIGSWGMDLYRVFTSGILNLSRIFCISSSL